MMRPDGPGAVRLLCLAAALAAALTLIVVSALGFRETREAMTAVRVAEAEAAVRALRADIDRALGFGIPLGELRGVAEYLAERAARLPDVRFFVVRGPDGAALHFVGVDGARLQTVFAQLPAAASGDDETAAGDKPLNVVAADGFVVVAAPLRDGAGVVAAGVQPQEITRALADDMRAAWPFWLGCIGLAVAWAAVAARGGVVEPAARLAAAMTAAADSGRFDLLLTRRARDPVGRCLFAFNAVVAGLHARRQGFAAQAEEVRNAVFDPAVADAAAALRDRTLNDPMLQGFGDGAGPIRHRDRRAGDFDVFAIPAAALGAGAAASGLSPAVVAAGAAVTVAAFTVAARRRRAARLDGAVDAGGLWVVVLAAAAGAGAALVLWRT